MAKQFSDVNCRYGAPMGRRSYGSADDCADRSIHLFRVHFVDGDYDDGGAYWGAGTPLYCARNRLDTYRDFTRARSRAEAVILLHIPPKKLIKER